MMTTITSDMKMNDTAETAALTGQLSERSVFDSAGHDMKLLMMYTRASFYAMEPSNAAAYAPVEACGAHEWSCIAHHWRVSAATHAADKPAAAEPTAWPLSMRLRGGGVYSADEPEYVARRRMERERAERAEHAERQRQQPPELLIDYESLRELERKHEKAFGMAQFYSDRIKAAEEISPEWLADLRREFDGETRITADNSEMMSEAPNLRNYRDKAKRTRDSLPARFYRMMMGEEWDGQGHSYSIATKRYRRLATDAPWVQKERERQQRTKRDYSKKKRPADDNARRQARRKAQREREKAALAAPRHASAHGQEGGGGGTLTEGGPPRPAVAVTHREL